MQKILRDIVFRTGMLRVYLLVMLMALYFLTWQQIVLGLFVGWIVAGIGISVVLHRYVSHKTFEFKNSFYKLISYMIAFMTGLGNPVVWASIHRQHHAFTDAVGDTQSPLQIGKLRTFFSMFEVPHNEWIDKHKQIMLEDKFNRFFTRHALILALVYPVLLYFLFGFDVFLVMIGIVIPVSLALQGYVNAFLHDDPIDQNGIYSKNIKGSLILFGENLHKEHHLNPNKPWYSNWDMGKYYIKLVGNTL
jgi:fatty-acid desaturase